MQPASEPVDSYRFTDLVTKRLIKRWIEMEVPGDIPWKPVTRVLTECRIALVSTAGIALKSDQPFDQDGERANPWWGDPSFRIIPKSAGTEDLEVYHLHIDPIPARQDMNCLLPLQRLAELAQQGVIGDMAHSHYSFMGYLLDPGKFLEFSLPLIIERLLKEEVDLVVLIPA